MKERGIVKWLSPSCHVGKENIVGLFDDYVNGLEGKTDLDPQKIVSDLYGIHTQEIESREGKITELSDTVSAKDTVINEVTSKLTEQKARNYDLASQVPGNNTRVTKDENEKPDGGSIGIADLFNKDVRMRHYGG